MPHHHHGVVALVTNPSRSRVLAQQKDEHYRPSPLGYSLFGGAVEPGETPAEALSRELLEELGPAAQVLVDARPVHRFTKERSGGAQLSLFEIVVDDSQLTLLGDVPVLEGRRAAVLTRTQLAQTSFIWGLGALIEECLEAW